MASPQQVVNRKSIQPFISGATGALFILAILVLAVVYPCPTQSQYNIFRIVLSIAVGALASIIPGLFQFRFKDIVSAAGALGVFALVFLYDPAKLITSDECNGSQLSAEGVVYVNGKERRNIDVRISQIKKSDITDEYGSFKIEYPKTEDKRTFNFRLIYGSTIDTSFELTNNNWVNLKFYLSEKNNVIAVNPKSASNDSHLSNVLVRKTPKNTTINRKQTDILDNKAQQISNYYEGTLSESSTAFYGGPPYCQFSMKYADISAQIKLSQDKQSVEIAKVTLKAVEKADEGCPYQAASPNKHIYDLANAKISGNDIFISFTPDHSNYPLCSLTMTGTIVGDKIVASFINERIDMAEPKLVYKIKIDIQLGAVALKL